MILTRPVLVAGVCIVLSVAVGAHAEEGLDLNTAQVPVNGLFQVAGLYF